MSAVPKKHLFSVTDWHTMEELGLFLPETRAELIEGEIIDMPSVGSRHAGCVSWLNNFFNSQLPRVAIVNMQNPIQLGDFSEPQPDIAVLRPDTDFYRKRHPTAVEVLLLIEVSDSSVNYSQSLLIEYHYLVQRILGIHG
jgi:Uma2 family endonuclease